MNRKQPLARRTEAEPALSRLPREAPRRDEILAAHAASLAAGEDGYLDPASGWHVFNARVLAARGWCCQNGCRHCPYVED